MTVFFLKFFIYGIAILNFFIYHIAFSMDDVSLWYDIDV